MTAESGINAERTSDAFQLAQMAGWSNAEIIIARRGKEAVIGRSTMIIGVYRDMLLTIQQKNPALAQLIATADITSAEPHSSGIQNSWGFALPRMALSTNLGIAQESLKAALSDQQKVDPLDAAVLIAFFANHLNAAGADRHLLLRAMFNRDKLIDSECGLDFNEIMWSIRNYAPLLYERYAAMPLKEKDRHQIADVRLPSLEDIHWNADRGHFELPKDDVVIDTLRPDIAAAIISPYQPHDRNVFPEGPEGEKLYDAHIQSIARINKKIALYLNSLRW